MKLQYMADGGVRTEGEATKSSKWASLRNLFRRRPIEATAVIPVNVTQEMTSVPVNSGYAQFLERLGKTNEARLVPRLRNEYPDLVSLINSSEGLTPETKQALLKGLNEGDEEIIAVLVARLASKLDKEVRFVEGRKNPVLKNKRGVAITLAKQMEPFFLTKGIARDRTGRMPRIVESWVRADYWEAVKTPNWLPHSRILAPAGIGKLPAGVEVSPVAPGKN